MEAIIYEDNKVIKSIIVEVPTELRDMLNSIEDLRQKTNNFLSDRIEEKAEYDNYIEDDMSNSDVDDSKQPVIPKKRKK